MNHKYFKVSALLALLLLVGCGVPFGGPSQPATVKVTFDLANGTTGFAATIFAQEVTKGTTVSTLYPVQSPPITMTLNEPGTYIFYATLIEAPDDYQYAATGCEPGDPCEPKEFLGIDVESGGSYEVIIQHRAPDLPAKNEPVTVPWHR